MPKETNARVVLVSDPAQQDAAAAAPATTNSAASDRLHQAAAKAQEARDLLDQALVPLHSPIERHVMLRKAFSTALEARKLVDPNISMENKKNTKKNKVYHELEQTKSLGEEEALEASRIISIMAGQQHVVLDTTETNRKNHFGDNERNALPALLSTMRHKVNRCRLTRCCSLPTNMLQRHDNT
ncbi:hypothetical protein MHU86_12189 [Fragilaria crotonensis]|nr:hypothetical protein MHU86_12189 [Fragilaria crotonensis]